MESSINSFRQILRQAWSRRVLLVVTTETPPPSIDRLTLDYIATLRDLEWEEQERSYHETALSEVNSLVRKYNGMAPYIARRALYTRNAELERLYKESAKEIREELVAKFNSKGDQPRFGSGAEGGEDPANPHGAPLPSLSIWAMVKKLFSWVRSFGVLWRFIEAFHSDLGLELGIRKQIDDSLRHRDCGIDFDWWGKSELQVPISPEQM
jgi:DnaJ homolog subfamily C member 28